MIELIYILRLLLSAFLGFIIGWEREQQDKSAGLRTIMLIGLGATMFTLLPFILLPMSKILEFSFDFSRIIAYTISSVGFLAGIVIIANKKGLKGVTTSACIWAIVGIGIFCGMGQYILAIASTLIVYLILKLKYIKIKITTRKNRRKK